VEGDGQGDEAGRHDDLQKQRRLDQGMASVHLRVGKGLVGGVAGAPAGEGLDDARQERKGGEDAAGVQRRVVRDIVQDAAEDMVICQLEERRSGIDEADGGDVNVKVVVVPGAVRAHSEAGREEEGAEGEEGR